jgi:hypothetical protein
MAVPGMVFNSGNGQKVRRDSRHRRYFPVVGENDKVITGFPIDLAGLFRGESTVGIGGVQVDIAFIPVTFRFKRIDYPQFSSPSFLVAYSTS